MKSRLIILRLANMYQGIYYQRSKNIIHLWDDKNGHLQFPYKRYAYKKNSHGKFSSLDNTRVDKVTEWDEIDEARGLIYESDINPVTRTLIDLYIDSDEMSVNHREIFLDIEVSTVGGFATGEDPWQPITSIAFHNRAADKTVCLLVDRENKIKNSIKDNLHLEVFSTETDLLIAFLKNFIEIRPTIITGWNIDFFDIPYLYNRINRVLGKDYANTLSPISEVSYMKNRNRYKIAGVSCLDYMGLYKLFTQNEEVSYSLDNISIKELGHGKIKYDGTLDHLYKTDLQKFIEYNVNDVLLVLELDEKLKFLSLARGICHKGHVEYEDVYQTTRYLDGACLTYMKRLGVVAPNRPRRKIQDESEETEEQTDFEGAYVKDPVPGLYLWTFDEDMTALYPSIMRSLNISPETKVGRIENWDSVKDLFVNGVASDKKVHIDNATISVNELRSWLINKNYSISSIGVVYDMSRRGLVPAILEAWSEEREEFRSLAKKHNELGDTKLADFFDLRQQVAKRMNNSLYGALGALGFRFNDFDNAESITISGQSIIKNAVAKGNEWFNKQLSKEEDRVIYVDTDSSFFSALPIIELMERKFNKKFSDSEKADITFKTSQAVEEYINQSWDDFAKLHFNVNSHHFKIKQEYVASAGFWIARKRYAQLIISEKGVSIHTKTKGKSEWKLDVKGMDVVRSDFPKKFREVMSKILIKILQQSPKEVIDDIIIDLRENLKNYPILDIMFPTGVKEVSKWVIKKDKNQKFSTILKGTPIHVKSALYYNDLLDYYESNTPKISDGDKIKWTYLRQNTLGLKTCALKGFEDPEEIVKFIVDHIDYEHIFESALENKLSDFYNALNYGAVPKNKNLENFFSF